MEKRFTRGEREICGGAIGLERVVRCNLSGWYLGQNGWTVDPRTARVFKDDTDAFRECVARRCSDVEMVLRAPSTRSEMFAVPLL